MKARVLFSGGKDSALASVILLKFFEVELVTCTFGLLKNWQIAKKVAEDIGLPFRVVNLDGSVIECAVEQIISDGNLRGGITHIHKSALQEVAKLPDSDIIADGCRREDMTPHLSRSDIRRIEDKFNVQYIQPLAGFGRKTIDILVDRHFDIEEKEGRLIEGSEYEYELREIIGKRYGKEKIWELFPKAHTHSRVLKAKSF